jgi:Glycosyl transferase family 2
MRIGKNPQHELKLDDTFFVHQIVIPVYIPNNSGYFKDALKILKACLLSLNKTAHRKTFITIINNGSSIEVINYLNEQLLQNNIQELIHTTNIGKNNAILKGVKGHNFKLITIADADVLFLNGWQDNTIKVFNEFPKAGVVGLVPQFKLYASLSFNVLFDNMFSKQLQFTQVRNPEAMKSFYRSIAWKDNYNKDYLKYHLTITSKSKELAVVGSGHFVATYKREALYLNSKVDLQEKLSPKQDRALLDTPVLKVGGWRLTTTQNYAYHMGNVHENWMDNQIANLANQSNIRPLYFNYKTLNSSKISYFIKNHLFRKLMQHKKIMQYFLISKGLPKSIAKKY